jgi:hypothetical protein
MSNLKQTVMAKQEETVMTAPELMNIISKQLRTLAETPITDKNMPRLISQSKEVGNLAGKAIALSGYELEKQTRGLVLASSPSLLPVTGELLPAGGQK